MRRNKSEARNPKSEINSNVESANYKPVWNIVSFEFWICFRFPPRGISGTFPERGSDIRAVNIGDSINLKYPSKDTKNSS
jgi:hypothetical protein